MPPRACAGVLSLFTRARGLGPSQRIPHVSQSGCARPHAVYTACQASWQTRHAVRRSSVASANGGSTMSEQELAKLVHRLRKIHRAERRRAWWHSRAETLLLSATFCAVAWWLWGDDSFESACFGAFGILLAIAAMS